MGVATGGLAGVVIVTAVQHEQIVNHHVNSAGSAPPPKAPTEDSPGKKPSTLAPGPHAGESIPARGPERDFTPGEREQINEIGRSTGCHTCGTTDPGTGSGNFVPDHQPPTGVVAPGEAQSLYPHCIDCSRQQGGEVRQKKPVRKPEDGS
jgi:hypothetical protein